MTHAASSSPVESLHASVTGADGKTRNLGRVDRKWWAPRLWFYKYVTFPRLQRQYGGK